MNEKVAFIGMGIMGRGMALNLLKAGYEVTVWNRTTAKTEQAAAGGASVAATPKEAAANATIIIVCVGATKDVEQVLFGVNGVADGAAPGSLVIDCSTISPVETREFGAKLATKSVSMLDAPISGGSEGAANGTLSIMVGGSDEDFARATPYLEAMGKTITHVGGLGDGQTVKAVNQILVVTTMQGIAEALVFAQAAGLDLEKTLGAVSGGAAGSWALTNRGPQMVERDFRPGFTIDWQTKDIRLVLEAADAFGVPLPTTSVIFQLYRTLQSTGHGGEGNHALVKALEQLTGIEVGDLP